MAAAGNGSARRRAGARTQQYGPSVNAVAPDPLQPARDAVGPDVLDVEDGQQLGHRDDGAEDQGLLPDALLALVPAVAEGLRPAGVDRQRPPVVGPPAPVLDALLRPDDVVVPRDQIGVRAGRPSEP